MAPIKRFLVGLLVAASMSGLGAMLALPASDIDGDRIRIAQVDTDVTGWVVDEVERRTIPT